MPPTPAAATAATRALVLRHGQSEWNALGRWQGTADIALTAHGRQQAARAAERLGSFDAIWASDLQRATVTALVIAESLGIGPVIVDPRLRETDVGPWEGLTHDQVEERWPGHLAAQRRPPGFEPYDQVASRVLAALGDIGAAHPGGEVLVVSHTGAIRAARRALGAADERLGNLAGAWFTIHPGGVDPGELVAVLDDDGPATEAL